MWCFLALGHATGVESGEAAQGVWQEAVTASVDPSQVLCMSIFIDTWRDTPAWEGTVCFLGACACSHGLKDFPGSIVGQQGKP